MSSVTMGAMYYLQLDGYNGKSILKTLVISLRENYLTIVLYLVILILVRDITNYYVWVLYLLLSMSMVITFLFGSKFAYIKKVNWTKRVIRLSVAFIFFYAIFQTVILLTVKRWLVVLLFPLYVPLTYFLLYLSVILLAPVEVKINDGYKRRAGEKLKNSPLLVKIGITGSYGKTSVKTIMDSILSLQYSVCASEKSFNTPMGLCKTINNNLKSTHEILIAEMGAKKSGEIKELCDFISPDIGVITAVGRQHMESFSSIDNVYKTKKELADSVSKCVFNLDNELVYKMYNEYAGEKMGVFVCGKQIIQKVKAKIKSSKKMLKAKQSAVVYFLRNVNNCVWAKNLICTDEGLVFNVYHERKFLFTARSKLLGVHNITNILLSTAVSVLLGVSSDKIAAGIWIVDKIDARLQKVTNSNGAIVINNGYNSNLDSAKYSLQTLSLFDNKIKVVVTPGLVECGDGYNDNKEFGGIVAKYANRVIVVGELNKDAISAGLKSASFDSKNITFVEKFSDAKRIMDSSNSAYVFLIENDLPENYRK